jgi:hypothetical protein
MKNTVQLSHFFFILAVPALSVLFAFGQFPLY